MEVRELLKQGGAGNARPIVGIRLKTMEWDLAAVRGGHWLQYTPETLAFIEHAVRVLRKWEAVYG